MTWLTKSLALDLLAITIDSLTRASERISTEPDPVNGDWPPTGTTYNMGGHGPTEREQESSAPQQQAAPAEEKTTEQAEEKTPEQDLAPVTLDDVRPILADIARQGGNDIIADAIHQAGANKLSEVPADKLATVLNTVKANWETQK